MPLLQQFRDYLLFGDDDKPDGWDKFVNTKVNKKSMPIYLESLNILGGKSKCPLNSYYKEMDTIFRENPSFIDCFKIHMRSCGFKINYDFSRLDS